MKKIVKYVPVVLLASLMLLVCACKSAANDTYAQAQAPTATATQFITTGGSSANFSATDSKTPSVRSTPTAQTGHATSTAAHTPTPTATQTLTRFPTATPIPTRKPTTAPTVPKGVNQNPWGYSFTPGSYIYNPPGSFCSYFNCISTFWNGKGYVVECQDNTYSKSGGISGSCSHHGGNKAILYAH